jgi:hypothetical protein
MLFQYKKPNGRDVVWFFTVYLLDTCAVLCVARKEVVVWNRIYLFI